MAMNETEIALTRHGVNEQPPPPQNISLGRTIPRELSHQHLDGCGGVFAETGNAA